MAEQISEMPAGFLELMGKMMDVVLYKAWGVFILNKEKGPDEVLELLKRDVGIWLADRFFESQYGSIFQSIVEVGRDRTRERVEECQELAGRHLWEAIQIAHDMSADDVHALAGRIQVLVEEGS